MKDKRAQRKERAKKMKKCKSFIDDIIHDCMTNKEKIDCVLNDLEKDCHPLACKLSKIFGIEFVECD